MSEFTIHDAAIYGDLEKVRQLIEAGVPVDSLNRDGQTPLHLAARYSQYEVARLLINSGCDLDIKDRLSFTPVMVAASCARKDIVDLLLDRGAQVNCVDYNGCTLLHWASFDTDADIVRLILDKGKPDLNAVDNYKYTPLMSALELGNEEVAVVLTRAGADVNSSDGQKRTALHFAAERGKIKMIQILLEKEGLHLSPQDVDGNTPLHHACQDFWREAIMQLLDAGADTNVKNNQGETALNIVIGRWFLFNDQVEEIRLFVQKGAFLENCDYECISRYNFLKDKVLKDVELCTQSVVNKFNCQSLPALNSIPYFSRRLPNVDNFKLGARHIDEVENLVRCEIERNGFCNVVKTRPIALSALCVLSLITCQSDKKRAASTRFGHSPFKKNCNCV